MTVTPVTVESVSVADDEPPPEAVAEVVMEDATEEVDAAIIAEEDLPEERLEAVEEEEEEEEEAEEAELLLAIPPKVAEEDPNAGEGRDRTPAEGEVTTWSAALAILGLRLPVALIVVYLVSKNLSIR